MTYSIKEVADMMGVTTSTLRYYDAEGLLPNIKKVNGRRVFEEKDFKWLRVLKCMKQIRMPITKIREYVLLCEQGESTLQERLNLILEQKSQVENEIKALQKCLEEFKYKEWYYKSAIELGTEKPLEKFNSDCSKLEIDTIPANFRKEEN